MENGIPSEILMNNSWDYNSLISDFAEEFPDRDKSSSFVYISIAFIFFTVCGLIANSLFCIVVLRCGKLHTVTHMLMTNLACCNIVYLLFYPAYLMNTFVYTGSWLFGTFLCKVCFSIIYISSTGSFWLMSLVAIDRWLAIFFRKRRLDLRKCIMLTLIIWVISFCVASPYIYNSEVTYLGSQNVYKCGCTDIPKLGPFNMELVTIFFQYIVPLLIITPAYAHIAHFLYSRPTIGVQSREKSRKQTRKRRRLLGTLLAIVALLIVSWMPIFAVRTISLFFSSTSTSISSSDSQTNAQQAINTYIYSTIVTLMGVTGIPICFLNNEIFRMQLFTLLSCLVPSRFQRSKQETQGNTNGTVLLKVATDIENEAESRMTTSMRSSRRGTPVDIALLPNEEGTVTVRDRGDGTTLPRDE